MKFNGSIRSIGIEDLEQVEAIIKPWLTPEEVSGYLRVMRDVIESSIPSKFDNHFYVALLANKVVGISAYRKPLPKLITFSSTHNPAELNMLYVAEDYRELGVGTALVNMIIDETKRSQYTELIIRSALKFKEFGWKFYDQFTGLHRAGVLPDDNPEKVSQIWAIKF